ncbi:hypothetical protein V8C37DRAFT_375427 [Trichoderma ceciliae]
MYEQWGFTPPSLPLPYTRGSFVSQLACRLLPVLFQTFLSETQSFTPVFLWERECCDSRPRALEADLYPSRLTLVG